MKSHAAAKAEYRVDKEHGALKRRRVNGHPVHYIHIPPRRPA